MSVFSTMYIVSYASVYTNISKCVSEHTFEPVSTHDAMYVYVDESLHAYVCRVCTHVLRVHMLLYIYICICLIICIFVIVHVHMYLHVSVHMGFMCNYTCLFILRYFMCTRAYLCF